MKNSVLWFGGLLVFELLLLFYFRNELGYLLSPVLLLITGCLIGLLPLFSVNVNLPKISSKLDIVVKNYFLILILTVLALLGLTAIAFYHYPIKLESSDILPLIKEVYVSRFLEGKQVYAPYTGFNYGTFTPNYLPFHWLPFVLPQYFGWDIRWASCFVYVIACLLFWIYLEKTFNKGFWKFILALLPLILWSSMLAKQAKDFAVTVEFLIAAYYLILGVAILSRKWYLIAFSLPLLMLSRYSLSLWLPVMFLSFFLWKPKQALYTLVVFIGICCLVYLPFWFQTPQMFNSGSRLWIDAALGEWKGQSWQAAGDKPFQLFQGMGFSSWIYLFADGTLVEKISFNKQLLQWIGTLVMIILMGLVILKRPKTALQHQLLIAAALKISLVFFYSFVFVPYVYLFWVIVIPNFILATLFLQKTIEENNSTNIR